MCLALATVHFLADLTDDRIRPFSSVPRFGALGRTRTDTVRCLRPLTLPLAYEGNILVGVVGLEPTNLSALAYEASAFHQFRHTPKLYLEQDAKCLIL